MRVPEDHDESTSLSSETLPKTDWLEFWVRFVCGALLGIVVSLGLVLNLIFVGDSFKLPASLIAGIVGVTLVCGLAAARYGDRFWYSILRLWRWRLWR